MGVTALLFSLGACTRSGSERPYKMIGSSPDAVQAAFNADMGRVRVLMLVSPTCGFAWKEPLTSQSNLRNLNTEGKPECTWYGFPD